MSEPEKLEGGFGPYRDLEFIGQGGMARVYRALDTRLGRTVALKLILGENPEFASRLLMEARAQARIDHPNVCKVFEAGEWNGRPYIAMQFISGRSLKECVPDLTLEEKVRLMRQVAEAVHSAHVAGLIHRDLKPANILVERNEQGEWIPYVVDFGLAREQEAPGLTGTGVIVGSPWYMSPEQARGESRKLDRRSDVYSLGASLYELLSGRTPFDSDSILDLLLKVVDEEPEPLRKKDPHIPADLDTIVLKCLEKEPSRRYESARALADDLRRYSEGEPIQAGPAGFAYRAAKRVRRHRVLAFTIIVALFVVLTVGIAAWRSQRTARRQAELEQQFGQRVREIEAVIRIAYMAPLHDVRHEQEIIRRKIRQIENDIRTLGKAGAGPGNYAIGRGLMGLREYESARVHLERAWKSGYQNAQVAYSLGLSLGQIYQRKLQEVDALRSTELREIERKRVELEYKNPALQYLKQGKGLPMESLDYAEALIYFYEKRYEPAMQKAKQTLKQATWFYESWKLQGDIFLEIGKQRADEGDYTGASQQFLRAQDAYETALNIARSDPDLYQSLCRLRTEVMNMKLYGEGGDLTDWKDTAIAACSGASEADPDRAAPRILSADALRLWSESLINEGKDPQEALKQASSHAREAIRVAPRDHGAHRSLGAVLHVLANHKMNRGLDPLPDLDESIIAFQHAITLDPSDSVVHNQLGNAIFYKAMYLDTRGTDPRRSYDEAVEAYRKTIQLNPSFSGSYSNLGFASTKKAEYEIERGLNPESSLNVAIEFLGKAVTLNPRLSYALNNLGLAYYTRGRHKKNKGEDPRDDWKQAAGYYHQTISINPGYPLPYYNKVLLYQSQAEYEWLTGENFQDSLRLGKEAFEAGFRVNRDIAEAYLYRAALHLVEAEAAIFSDQDPTTALKDLRTYLAESAAIDSTRSDTPWMSAEAGLLEAQWKIRSGMNPERQLGSIRLDIELTVTRKASDAQIGMLRGRLYCWTAEWNLLARKDASEPIRLGLEEARKIQTQYPGRAEAVALESALLLLQAKTEPGSQSRETARLALSRYQRAIEMNPTLRRRFESVGQQAAQIASGQP